MIARVIMVLTVLFAGMLSGGCSMTVERTTIEDLAMIGVLGIDYVDGHNVKVTISYPQPSEGNKGLSETQSAESQFVEEGVIKLSSASDRSLSTAQVRVVLFGEELARKQGVMPQVKHLYRDPTIGDSVLFAIVRGSAEEMMKHEYGNKPEFSTYMNNLLHPRQVTAFSPFMTLHRFVFTATDQVSDPMMPIVKLEEDTVKITGVALFKGDKMIGELSDEEARLGEAVREKQDLPNMKLYLGDRRGKTGNHVILQFVHTNESVRSSGLPDSPHLHIKLKLRANLMEYSGSEDLEKPEELEKLEARVSRALRRDVLLLLEKLQKLGIDPLSLGESIRSKTRGAWSKEHWEALLAKTSFDAEVRTQIVNYGVLK
ncbi:Ger(x)C family spore germination protein [Paenibacillus sp. MBLB4367]|uniref:Ger(x)C family spore germination protein n=1 Tax=Paenibacillus sp. MBLB4367 TaxID=3384767 RepID=UPI003907F02D